MSDRMHDEWRDLRIDLPNGYDADNKRATALLAERDALAERVDALHKALRDHVLRGPITDNDHDGPFVSNGCMHCNASWSPSTTESHAPDCLARPSTPRTEAT